MFATQRWGVTGGVMIKRLVGWVLLASVSTIPIAAFAQVQVNQNFVSQGPAPAFGPTGVSRSADAPPNGNVTGAIGPVIADPLNANRFFIGTVGGGLWSTTNGGVTWTPLTDKQATLSISSLAFDPTDPNRNTLIAGTGLTANGTVCQTGPCFFTGSGGLRNGLLYSNDGGSTWTSLGAATLGGRLLMPWRRAGMCFSRGPSRNLSPRRRPSEEWEGSIAVRMAGPPSRWYPGPVDCRPVRSTRSWATPTTPTGFMRRSARRAPQPTPRRRCLSATMPG